MRVQRIALVACNVILLLVGVVVMFKALSAFNLFGLGDNQQCDPTKISVGMTEQQVVAVCGKPTARWGGERKFWKDASGTRTVITNAYLSYDHANGDYDLVVLDDGVHVDHVSRNLAK